MALQPQPLALLRSPSQHLMGVGAGSPWHPRLQLPNPERARCCGPKHVACASVCQQVIVMSTAGRRRQLGWLAIPQIYCKCNRERQDGSPGAAGGRGEARCVPPGVLADTDRQHQAPAPQTDPKHRPRAQTLSTDPEYRPRAQTPPAECIWQRAAAEPEQPWLPGLAGEPHCSSPGKKPCSAPGLPHKCHLSKRLFKSITSWQHFGVLGWTT